MYILVAPSDFRSENFFSENLTESDFCQNSDRNTPEFHDSDIINSDRIFRNYFRKLKKSKFLLTIPKSIQISAFDYKI
jgi:hypothetical protein